MSSTVVDTKRERQTVEGNSISTGSLRGPFTPEADNSLVDHPLWLDFLAELQASRQADKAAAELEWAAASE